MSSEVIQEPLCPSLLLLGLAGSVAIVHGYAVRKFCVYLLEPLLRLVCVRMAEDDGLVGCSVIARCLAK